jgi:hypothetical protein
MVAFEPSTSTTREIRMPNFSQGAPREHGVARLLAIGALAALSLIATVPTATASVAIGQTSSTGFTNCGPDTDRLQPTVTAGTAYVVPSTGGVTAWTLTSWSTVAGADPQHMAMKVFRSAGGENYTAVGHEGPHDLSLNALNTFPAHLAVKPGDILGLYTLDSAEGCIFSVIGESYLARFGNLADGEQGAFPPGSPAAPDFRLNISAVLDPVNTFTINGIARNKKKGTATAAITTQNPGTLAESGKGVKAASSSKARSAVSVGAAGTVNVPIRAKGKKKTKLRTTGKVKLSPTFTFTPTGGAPSAQTIKVKLKKKL